MGNVVGYSSYLGEVLAVSGLGEGATAADLAAQYMGALTVGDDSSRNAAVALAAAAAKAADPDESALTSALFSLCDPALQSMRDEYAACLDATMAAAAFSDADARKHSALAASLGMPPALAQRLGLDAYYGWLLDASERSDRGALESAAQVRDCLQVNAESVAELYANTEIDELALTTCCEAEEAPLTTSAINGLAYVEGQLAARPGVLTSVVAAAGADE